MNRTSTLRKFAFSGLGLSLTLVGAVLVGGMVPDSGMRVISTAEAIVGRPLTPVSGAGVARRTTRRTVAVAASVPPPQTTQTVVVAAPPQADAPPPLTIVQSPPPDCAPNGSVFVCGGMVYKPVMQGNSVVYSVHPVE